MRPEWRSRPKRSALFYEGGEDFDDDDEDNKNIRLQIILLYTNEIDFAE